MSLPLPDSVDYPGARRDASAGYTVHGRWFADPYAWMEDLASQETSAWVEAQEALTRSVLDAAPGRDWLRERLKAAHAVEPATRPMTVDGSKFRWATHPGDQKPRFVVRYGTSAPVDVINPNSWPEEDALTFAVPSPDGHYVAFGRAEGGTHNARIFILEVESGAILADRPYGVDHASIAWRPDSSGFFYSASPDPADVTPGDEAMWNAIYEHRIGSSERRRVFGDDDNKEYWCSVSVSECGRFAILSKWDFVHANESWLLRLADGELIAVAPDMTGLTTVQVIGTHLLIWTDRNAPRGRACIAPLDAPRDWQTIIPEGDDTLQAVAGVGGRIYAVYSRAAAARIAVTALAGETLREVTLPALGSVNRNTGDGVECGVSGSWHGDDVWIAFESFVQPRSLYRYDFDQDILDPSVVPDAGFEAKSFETRQVWFESKDGTRVPMFLVHGRGRERDGAWPIRLNGYGGFNISVEPRFTPVNVAWLQAGGVLAFANIRGGGEFGREWHHAATKTRRQNAFDDFIAAARFLVSEGYTTPDRIAVRGNSNGGILAAVTMLQAPEAFGAVFCRAATLDMLQFPKFSHMASATVEFGSPDDPVEGPYLAGYSPYHNVRSGVAYPPAVFVAALNDRLAPPYDPLKMVARLQAEASGGGPYFLLPLRSSGHAGGTTLGAIVEQDLDELAFYCQALKVTMEDLESLTALQ